LLAVFGAAILVAVRKDTPSRTARKVALNVVMLGTQPRTATLLPAGSADATARLLVAAGVANERTLRLARRQSMVALVEWFDWMMPGQFEGFARRKQFCERQVRRAIDDGATQVLVLGAGYDTLGWRLAPAFPKVRFYEIDHPATAGAKAKGVAKLGPHANLHLVAEDLAHERLSDVLARVPDWDVSADSIVVAEGLLMYLPATAVRELFQQIAASSGHGSRVVFSYVGQRGDGRPDAGPWSRLALWTVSLMGEPWLWGHPAATLDDFLRPCGWQRVPPADDTPTRAGIEHLAVARRAPSP
jgi:methyltransferase (TIGR00027 family)